LAHDVHQAALEFCKYFRHVLWNAVLVPAVHAEEIGYWQSVSLLLLSVIVGAAAKSVTISRRGKE
jgi:hypothetical protein